MKTKTQAKQEEETALRAKIQEACGISSLSDWSVTRYQEGRIVRVIFRVDETLTLAKLEALSAALGTSGGWRRIKQGRPGWIEVLFGEAP